MTDGAGWEITRRRILTTAVGTALLGTVGVPRPTAARSTGPGDELWSARVAQTEAGPAVVGDTVYVGSVNANLHALNRADGAVRWSFGGEGDDRASRQSSPTVVDGTAFVGSFEGNVYAVDTDTGEEEWRFETGDEVWSSPTVVDGTVFVASDDGFLYALNAADGSSVWEFESSVIQGGGSTVADGTVYFSARRLHALDMNGEERWSTRTPAKEAVAVVDGTVFVGQSSGTVLVLDAATGDESWSFEIGETIWGSPEVAGGTVYIGSEDDNVYAIDAESGEEKWSFDTGSWVRGSVTVAGGVAYVGSLAGAFALETGATPETTATTEGTGETATTEGTGGTATTGETAGTTTAAGADGTDTTEDTDGTPTGGETETETPGWR